MLDRPGWRCYWTHSPLSSWVWLHQRFLEVIPSSQPESSRLIIINTQSLLENVTVVTHSLSLIVGTPLTVLPEQQTNVSVWQHSRYQASKVFDNSKIQSCNPVKELNCEKISLTIGKHSYWLSKNLSRWLCHSICPHIIGHSLSSYPCRRR